MTPERWEQVGQIFQAAAALQPQQRSAFLSKACGADENLRREVESLLKLEGQAGDFLGAGAMEDAARVLAEDKPPSLVGKQLGRYEVLELVEGGNMGEVYRARDTALKRHVAVKVLPLSFSQNADRLRRFKQEPLAVSSFNHPNIVTIYEIGEVDHWHFMVSEFIEGETLRQRMTRGRMKLAETLDVAIQIASALEAAHRVGIVHRDIKPENVMVRPDGLVKVLDFGLAKLIEPPAVQANEAHATGAALATRSGMIMGTARYMSPEQARGLAVDARSDIWSLGVVLYEMVAGCAPFAGATDSDVLVSILEREPLSLTQNSPEVPPELQRIVSKALRKDREERYQVVKDMLLDLRSLSQELDFEALRQDREERYQSGQDPVSDPRVSKPAAGSDSRIGIKGDRALPSTRERLKGWNWLTRLAQRRLVRWLIAIAVLGLTVAAAVTVARRPPLPPRIIRTVQLTNNGRDKNYLGTDGARLYFYEESWQTAGFVQMSATGGETTLIPASFFQEKGQGNIYDISRDRNEMLIGKWDGGEEPALWAMSVIGGPARRLGDLRGHGACWSPDGQRVAYVNGPDLYIAKSDGTASRKLATPRANGFVAMFPSWSPDGSRLRFNLFDWKDTATLWEETVDGTGLHPLNPGWKGNAGWGGRWTPDGRYYLFLVGGDLRGGYGADIWAIRETKSFFGKVDREPIKLTFGPVGFFPPVFSPDSKRIFTMGYLPHGELDQYDAPTKHWLPFLSGISVHDVDFSRDGLWVTYVTYPDGPLWRSRTDGSQRLQLTPPEIRVRLPRWSPDGKQIAFSGQVSGQHFQIYVVSTEGGNAERLIQRNCDDIDPTWSPDGNSLVFAPFTEICKLEIYRLDLKSRQLSTIVGSEGLYSPRLSPDGKSIVAIKGDHSGLMLFSFATQKWEEVAKGFASFPGWSHDGRFVYFMDDFDVVRVRIADHKIEKAVSLTDVHLKFDSSIGLSPDDSLLVLRETSVREIYALDWEAP